MAVPPAPPSPDRSQPFWWAPYLGAAFIGLGMIALGVYDHDNQALTGPGILAAGLGLGVLLGIKIPTQ